MPEDRTTGRFGRGRRYLKAIALAALMTSGCPLGAVPDERIPAREPLPIEERCRLTEALERVYAVHRAAAGQSAAQTGPDSGALSTLAREKALDAARKAEALETLYGLTISPEQIQAELDRMARETRQPEILAEIFAALGNDPRAAAEVLARPVLADLLLRAAYAADRERHEEARSEAEGILAPLVRGQVPADSECRHRAFTAVPRSEDSGRGRAAKELAGAGAIEMAPSEWEGFRSRWPDPGSPPVFAEDAEGFTVLRASPAGEGGVLAESWSVPKVPFDLWWSDARASFDGEDSGDDRAFDFRLPTLSGARCGDLSELVGEPPPRAGGSAHWTGSEVLFWGGSVDWSGTYGSGGLYDPDTLSWRPMASSYSVLYEASHGKSVWTGSEMIVFIPDSPEDQPMRAARYDLTANAWRNVNRGVGCPPSLLSLTAVWTGSEVILWGMIEPRPTWSPKRSGGWRYDPAADSWRPISTAGAPSPRLGHVAVWTGTEMIVWGGTDYDGTRLLSGGRYDPASDSWRPTAVGVGAPLESENVACLWTGREMLVWGGGPTSEHTGSNTGALYDPSLDRWRRTSTSGAPEPRLGNSAVWTGSEMIVWGGCARTTDGGSGTTRNLRSGGRYDPLTDTWAATSTGPLCPVERTAHLAAWTGSEMVVIGGARSLHDAMETFSGGRRYDPASDAWFPMGVGEADLGQRGGESAVWTGAEFVVWGGVGRLYEPMDTGAAYDPATARWRPTARDWETPSPRIDHTAVWTGEEMVIWGGGGTYYFDDSTLAEIGAAYDPAGDRWRTISTGPGTPWPRRYHTAVWTGSEMVVWGGVGQWGSELNSGSRYDPEANRWTPLPDGGECPEPRGDHSAVWTGKDMIVWGGVDPTVDSGKAFANGGRYDPASNRWKGLAADANAPGGRSRHRAVWTGDRMIVWGGEEDQYGELGTGGIYNPGSGVWSRISTGAGCPSRRSGFAAAWTGAHLIVFGGTTAYPLQADGGLYDKDLNAWTSLSGGPWRGAAALGMVGTMAGSVAILFRGQEPAGWTYRPCMSVRADWSRRTDLGPGTVAFSAEVLGGFHPYSYDWDFGDASPHGTEAAPLHAYGAPGTYAFSVAVTDAAGDSATASGTLTLAPPPSITGIAERKSPYRLTLTGSGFAEGVQVHIGGGPAPSVARKSESSLTVGKGAALQALLPKGVPKVVRVTNPDGGYTERIFTRMGKSNG